VCAWSIGHNLVCFSMGTIWFCLSLGISFKISLYMFNLRKSLAQSCMLLVECYFESILMLIILGRIHVCD
jgi:hypothetical protein